MHATVITQHLAAKPREIDAASTDATSAGETSCENESSRSSSAGLNEEERGEASASGSVEACFAPGNSVKQTHRSADEKPSAAKRQRASRLPHARRQAMAKKKYRRNANGTYTKIRAISEWDLDCDGAPREFDSEQALLEHEERCYARRRRGEHPKKYGALSKDQSLLAAVVRANAEENTNVVCEALRERTGEMLEGLHALGEKMDSVIRAEQVSDQRFALRELLHESLKACEIRALLEAHGVKTTERRNNKWTLASTAAAVCTSEQVHDFLAGRQNPPRDGQKKTPDPKRGHDFQTTFPITKKVRRSIGDVR